MFEVSLGSSLAAGKSLKVTVEMVFSHALRAFPERIAQAEKQSVVFEGNHYFLSPYKTVKQTTTVKLASSTVESYSKLKPSSQDEETITYGPYENIAPLQTSNMKIHYENNSPFLTVSIYDGSEVLNCNENEQCIQSFRNFFRFVFASG